MLVPCGERDGVLECYGDAVRDYASALLELEVLYSIRAEVSAIAEEELQKLLKQYYRNDAGAGRGKIRQISEIASGQGFLMGLIEEAFDNYASDIHVEAYEERCRVRFRMDGKLIERYVIEKGNYSSLINQIKIIANLDISEKRLPQDGRILFNSGGKKFDVRVSCLPTIYGEKVVLRLLTRHVELLELANLGFSAKQLEDYCAAVEKPYGRSHGLGQEHDTLRHPAPPEPRDGKYTNDRRPGGVYARRRESGAIEGRDRDDVHQRPAHVPAPGPRYNHARRDTRCRHGPNGDPQFAHRPPDLLNDTH